jgi:hypothetical protein
MDSTVSTRQEEEPLSNEGLLRDQGLATGMRRRLHVLWRELTDRQTSSSLVMSTN